MGRSIILLLILFLPSWGSNFNWIVPGKMIVKFKNDAYSSYRTLGTIDEDQLPDSIKNLNKLYKGQIKRSLYDHKKVRTRNIYSEKKNKRLEKVAKNDKKEGLDKIYVIELPADADIEFIAAQYTDDDNIEYAEPVFRYVLTATTPNDTLYTNQTTNLPQVSAEDAWDISTGNSSTVIAIIDTGVLLAHEDFSGKIDTVNDYDFVNSDAVANDDQGHGTGVAGIAAAQGNNAKGVTGLDWNATILPIKVLDASGVGDLIDIIDGVNHAKTNNADIINMSLAGPEYAQSFNSTIQSAIDSGVIVIAAMGNVNAFYGITKTTTLYPAAYNRVIGVGSTDSQDQPSYFSVVGSGGIVDVVAPGEDIYSTKYNGSYGDIGIGTSYSAPLVAGLAGLIIDNDPLFGTYGDNREQTRMAQILESTADKVGGHYYDNDYGYGRINAYNALSSIQPTIQESDLVLENVLTFPNPSRGDQAFFSFTPTEYVSSIEIKVYTLDGREVISIDGGSAPANYIYKKEWDCKDNYRNRIANGTYLYIITAESSSGTNVVEKGKMSIVR